MCVGHGTRLKAPLVGTLGGSGAMPAFLNDLLE